MKLQSFSGFILNLSIISILLGAISFILSNTLSLFSLPLHIIIFIPVFFFVTTAILHYLFLSASRKEPKLFIRYFMASTGMKLFIYALVIIIYAVLNKEQAAEFILFFLVSYLVYTTFEIFSILRIFHALSALGK
jgi:hypothetical protein